MNFFKQLSELMDGIDVNLSVRKSNEELTILLQPKTTDKELKTTIKPLTIKGSPEEMDEHFFGTVSAPVKKAAGIIAGIEVFEKEMEQTKKAIEEKANKKRESLSKKPSAVSRPVDTANISLPSEERNNDSQKTENNSTEIAQNSLF